MLGYMASPKQIEEKSFSLIRDKIKRNDLSQEELEILYRVVHTTADWGFEKIFQISNDFLEKWYKLILTPRAYNKKLLVYVDTKMIKAGVSKFKSDLAGIKLFCPNEYKTVVNLAQRQNLTRAIVGIDWTVEKRKNTKIFVIGNSPTALFRLCEHVKKDEQLSNILVIGVPVGFVGAKESKEILKSLGIPYIVIDGEKGGSTIAVAIMNALLNLTVKKLGFDYEFTR